MLASKVLAGELFGAGFKVVIGETFGSSQRGGAVTSHLRVSRSQILGPQIPMGQAQLVIGLEPIETLRVIESYGNQEVKSLVNDHFIIPPAVLAGRVSFVGEDEVRRRIEELSQSTYFIPATQKALVLNNPILTNIIMIGALHAMEIFPLGFSDFEATLVKFFPPSKLKINYKAFRVGEKLIDQ